MKRLIVALSLILVFPVLAWPACDVTWDRSKDWGTNEVLTDTDLEAEFDRVYTFGTDCFSTSAGHDHDGINSRTTSTSSPTNLDWDDVWADAVHDHTTAAEGSTVSNVGFTIHGVQIASGGIHRGTLDVSSVETGHIVDSAVTSAKVDNTVVAASGTPSQGEIAYFDGTNWARLAAGTSGNFLKTQGVAANPTWQDDYAAIAFIIDGGGSAITTGEKGHLRIPFSCDIDRVTVLADASGSIVVDLWADTYANFPPTNADSITASAPPTLSSAQKSKDSTLTGWTTQVTTDHIWAYNVDSATTVTRVLISARCKKD